MGRRWLNQSVPVTRGGLYAVVLLAAAFVIDLPFLPGIAAVIIGVTMLGTIADWLDR